MVVVTSTGVEMSAREKLREVLQETLRSILGDQLCVAASIAVPSSSEVKEIIAGVGDATGSKILDEKNYCLTERGTLTLPTGIFHWEASAGAKPWSDHLSSVLSSTRNPAQQDNTSIAEGPAGVAISPLSEAVRLRLPPDSRSENLTGGGRSDLVISVPASTGQQAILSVMTPSKGEGGERAGGVEVRQEDLCCGDSGHLVVHSASHENSCSEKVLLRNCRQTSITLPCWSGAGRHGYFCQ